MKHIFLYGPPGSGKSSVGKALAEKLQVPFTDVDLEIEKSAGKTISQIMQEQGESGFRDLEAETLKRVADGNPSVIALGGGALLRPENRQYAEQHGHVVLLEVQVPTLIERLQKDINIRPLLAGNLQEKLPTLLEQRREHYNSFPTSVSQSGEFMPGFEKTPEQIASEIQQKLNLLRVHTAHGNFYDVMIRSDSLDALGGLMRERELGSPVAVVADETVAHLYAERALKSVEAAGYDVHLITFPPGEKSKNIDTVMKLWQGMLEIGLDRKSTVVALGGGVTGDLAGFAAATFMRGINWVSVPTTLLAMVDSSLGGKTGFDLTQGKNLVGSFHDPELVLADPELLSTLPFREISAGMAEVVKHGMIGDPELFFLTRLGWDDCRKHLTELISRAMAVKINIIEKDPFESHIRAALNLGHTVGHAAEVASDYRLVHGEAVSIGLVAETLLAESLGIAEKGLTKSLTPILAGFGLPVYLPDEISRQSMIQAIQVDKKRANGTVHFTLPVRIGDVRVGVEISDLEMVLELTSKTRIMDLITEESALVKLKA